jgi:RHH-type proline utilization regulon transcriptional repressor/proline dehydrogenase/delta 1-pyrroline-5-carboxylate dehydrogenase
LDTREQTHWTERIEAGNLYINRTTTGAIVQRQPFGGLKKSAIAAGTNKPETRSAWKTSVPSLLRRLSENSLPL